MSGLHFDITGDNSNILRKLQETKEGVKSTSKQIEESGVTIEDLFGRLAKGAAAIGAGFTAKELISKIVNVRGEFQQLEVAFKTMLGSETKANTLMTQLVDTAAKTPFDLQGVANGAKQLLAYGLESDKVNGTLIRLGDIASGLSIPLGDLVYLYGTTMTQGRLYTQDLNQFIGRGIPMVKELAKQFNVAESEVRELVTAGKVGFPEVQRAIESMTNKGSKFGGLMEEQSKTITGQISNIGDAITTAFNSLGQQSEGVINASLSGVSALVENWQKVGQILVGLVATYGTYKVACMAVTAIHSAQVVGLGALTTAEAVHYGWIVMMQKAQAILNATMLTNPYVLLSVALVGAGAAIWTFADHTTTAEKVLADYNKTKEKTAELEKKHKEKIDNLLNSARDDSMSNLTRQKSLEQLQKEYPKIFKDYDIETLKLADILKLKKLINEEDSKRSSEKIKGDYKTTQDQIKYEEDYLKRLNSNANTDNYAERKSVAYKLKQLYLLRSNQEKDLLNDNLSQYKVNIANYSKEKVKAELKALQDARKSGKRVNVNGISMAGSRLDSYIESLSGSLSGKKDKVKDKSYWEELKKNTQGDLDALTDIEAKGKEGEALRKKITEYDERLKAYSVSSSNKDSNEAAKLAEQHKKNTNKSNDEEIALELSNQQKSISLLEEGRAKKIAQIKFNYQSQEEEIKKQAKQLAETNKDAGIKGNANGLTDSQQKKIDEANKLNNESRLKATNDLHKEEIESMRNYLMEYGTFQQQKLAITEEYAEKISKAQTEGEKLTLEKQRDSALTNVDVKAAQQNIDWQSVFGDLGMILKEQVQPTIDNLKTIVSSDQFQNSSVEDQQKIYDILSKLEQQSGSLGKDMFKDVSRDLELYRNSLNRYNEAQERANKALNDLTSAQNNLKKAQENGGDTTAAQNAVDVAQESFNQASESVKFFSDKVQENSESLTTSAEKTRGALLGLSQGLSALKSGSLQQAFDGIKGIGKSIGGKIGEAIGFIDPTGIISEVLGIADLLKDGISSIFVSLQDSVYEAVEGILNDVFSGDIITKPLGNAMEHVNNILNTITFGGMNSWLGDGDSDVNLERDLEYLAQSNSNLKQSIDNLSDKMNDASVTDANDIYETQKANLEQLMKNKQEAMYRSGDASKDGTWWKGYTDGEHSSFYKVNKGMSDSDWKAVSKAAGVSVKNASDFFNLTSEQMANVANDATSYYTKIKNLADDGYKDAAQYMDDYIDYYKQLDELENSYREKLTDVSFDSVRDEFKNTLLDMESSTEDFTSNFEKMIQNAIVESLMTQKYDKLIKSWYNNFAKYMENDGKIDTNEQNSLKNEWDDIVSQGVAERDALKNAMGWNTSSSSTQDSTSKGYNTMDQETGNELNGRFTALQVLAENNNQTSLSILSCITQYLGIFTSSNGILDEIKNLTITSNSYLENIAKYTKDLIGCGEKLDKLIKVMEG